MTVVGESNWSDELQMKLMEALFAFEHMGPCSWCGERGHETDACWVNAQAYRNCESRRVMH